MPRKAETPEHWKEGADQPEWATPDDDAVFDNSKYETDPDMVYEEGEPEHIDLIDAEPEDLLNDPGTDRDLTLSDKEKQLDLELDKQTEKWEKMQAQKKTKKRIKDKKTQIRHMKYAPAYEAGAKLKSGASKLKSAIDKKRGSPMERKARRDKGRAQLKKLAGVAKKKAISFGKSMKEDRSGKKPGMTGGGFGSKFFNQSGEKNIGSGSPKIMNMNINAKGSKSKLTGNTGIKLMDSNINLLGNTGNKLMGSGGGMFKQSGSNKPGAKFMQGNILGDATGNKDNKKRLW